MNIINLYKLNIECEDVKKYQNNPGVHHLTCDNQHDLKPVLIRNNDTAEVCLVCDLCKYIQPYSGAVKDIVSLVKDNNMNVQKSITLKKPFYEGNIFPLIMYDNLNLYLGSVPADDMGGSSIVFNRRSR